MLFAKAAYLLIYWLEAIFTVVLVRRYGEFYEANPLARWLIKTFGVFAVFLLPIFVGTVVVLFVDFWLVIIALTLMHGFFLLEHMVLFVRRKRYNDEKVRAYVESEADEPKVEFTRYTIAIFAGFVLVMCGLVTYHFVTTRVL